MGNSFAVASHFQGKWIVTKNAVKIQQIKLIIMILCTSLNPKCYAAVLSCMCSFADKFFLPAGNISFSLSLALNGQILSTEKFLFVVVTMENASKEQW